MFFTVQLYLPPEIMMTKDFLRSVLKEKKKLMKLSDVKFISVPKYDELSVKTLFPHMKNDSVFM